MTENEVELSKVNQNSITLKKDSKGNYNWDIKIYFDDLDGKALERLTWINNQLKEEYL